MSLDFICGSLPGEGNSKSKGHNGSWHVGGSARRATGLDEGVRRGTSQEGAASQGGLWTWILSVMGSQRTRRRQGRFCFAQ